jgi:UDP-glucose 4-epimerase
VIDVKYTITGGAGFIGSNIAKFLLNSGHSLQIIDNMTNAKILNPDSLNNKVEFHQVDILDFEKLQKLLINQDGIFHHAALIDVQESFENEDLYYKVNVQGTKNIFGIAKNFDIKVVFASSAAVYGESQSIPVDENSPTQPINPYGKTKLESEIIAKQFVENGAKLVGLRYFNVYGPCQSSAYAGVITKFFDKLTQGKPPIIYGDGNQIRDFVFVNDIAEANLKAMENDTSSTIINIASGKPTKIVDLARFMIKSFGYDFDPIFLSPKPGDIQKSLADIALASKLLDWTPKTKLEDWIESQINKN